MPKSLGRRPPRNPTMWPDISLSAVAVWGGPRTATGQPAGQGARVSEEGEEHGGFARAGEKWGLGWVFRATNEQPSESMAAQRNDRTKEREYRKHGTSLGQTKKEKVCERHALR